MSNELVWVRWYKKYADGMIPNKEQDYEYQWYNKNNRSLDEISSTIEIDIEETINCYEEGEHYRGFKWEFIDNPPKWYIEEELERYKNSIKHSQKMINIFENYI